MAKFAILVALLATFLFLSHASAYRTTITRVEVDDDDININAWQSEQRCWQQLKKVNLEPCEQHILDRIRQQQQQQPEEPKEEVITLHGRAYKQQRDEKKKQCCNQLKQVDDEKCQCAALQQIMKEQKGQMQGKLMQRLQQELMNLPESCGLKPLQECQLRGMEPVL